MATSKSIVDHMDNTVCPVVWFGPSAVVVMWSPTDDRSSMDHMDHLVWPVVWFGPSVIVDVVTNGSIMDHRDHLVWSVVLLLWSPENSQLLVWCQ